MDIITTARHFELTPEVRAHARKRLERLRKYAGGIDEVHVVLSAEKYRQIAEVALRARGTEVVSREETDDMLMSIDRVVDRVERQIQRLRARRRQGRRGAAGSRADAPDAAELPGEEIRTLAEGEGEEAGETAEEEAYPPVVVRGDEMPPAPLTVEQAIEMLKSSGAPFLVFRNARSARIAVVHLRPDGNYGLVEPA